MIRILLDNPLLLLFTVAAIGYPLGRIKIGGSSLGVAAVLFVGLAIGSLDPNLKLPEIIYQLGLVVFIYTVGLSSGPGFFASFRRKGLRDNLLVMSMISFAAVLASIGYYLLNLKQTLAVGMFTGSLTNTPALASVIETLKGTKSGSNLDQILAEPVVGYSVTYPIGVIGMLVAVQVTQRLWKVDYAAEAQKLRELGASNVRLKNLTLRVTKAEATRIPIDDLLEMNKWEVIFGRIKRGDNLFLSKAHTTFVLGDLVSVIGVQEDLERVIAYIGEVSEVRLDLDRSKMDFRRMFVSNPKIAGHSLRELDIQKQYGALITRVRRGDVEFLPNGDTVLELGDRVRVLALNEHMKDLGTLFGDSYKALSEIDVLALSLGVALGLLVGIIPVPLPGGIVLKLGSAGGPLIVALILGRVGRTGPFVWNLPYSANLTLRQFGLILFLAGVGTRAGYPFVSTFTQGGGIYIFLFGALITCVVAFLTLWIGYKVLKIPMGLLTGMLSGLQTQPAVLGYSLEQAGNDLPNIGYATVYPIATITKIIAAQVLLALLI